MLIGKWTKVAVVVLMLAAGACGGNGSGTSSGRGGAGGTGGIGGGGAGSGGAGPTSIAECATLSSPQDISDCIINLPTDKVGQGVSFTPAADYTTCKM